MGSQQWIIYAKTIMIRSIWQIKVQQVSSISIELIVEDQNVESPKDQGFPLFPVFTMKL